MTPGAVGTGTSTRFESCDPGVMRMVRRLLRCNTAVRMDGVLQWGFTGAGLGVAPWPSPPAAVASCVLGP